MAKIKGQTPKGAGSRDLQEMGGKKKFIQFFHTMEKESDRGSLLVGMSAIDEMLGLAIGYYLSRSGAKKDAEWLLDPKAGDRPLANLAIRTRIAVCLGIISEETRTVIDEVRKIRNRHAHGIETFDLTDQVVEPAWASWCDETRNSLQEFLALDAGDKGVAWKKLVASVFEVRLRLLNYLRDARKGAQQKRDSSS